MTSQSAISNKKYSLSTIWDNLPFIVVRIIKSPSYFQPAKSVTVHPAQSPSHREMLPSPSLHTVTVSGRMTDPRSNQRWRRIRAAGSGLTLTLDLGPQCPSPKRQLGFVNGSTIEYLEDVYSIVCLSLHHPAFHWKQKHLCLERRPLIPQHGM